MQPCLAVKTVPSKETPESVTPGDFILFKGDNWISKLISFGQAIRYRGKDKKFTEFTHAALITNTDGSIIEATANGILASNLSKYWEKKYVIVHIDAPDLDRLEAVNFATSRLCEKYGWFTVVSIFFTLLTASKFAFNIDGEEICSGLVARALERTSAIFPRDPSHISPAELAKQYNVV